MQLNERYRKFPIKFYQTEDGVYYENPIMSGKAKDMDDAFNQIRNKNLDFDLYYFYDDVEEIKIGSISSTKTHCVIREAADGGLIITTEAMV